MKKILTLITAIITAASLTACAVAGTSGGTSATAAGTTAGITASTAGTTSPATDATTESTAGTTATEAPAPEPTDDKYFVYTLLPDGTYSIDRYGYAALPENLVIPSEHLSKPVTVIVANAFQYEDIKTVYIPASIKIIEKEAFENCDNLTKVTFAKDSEGVLICQKAFSRCYFLTEITFPKTVADIEESAFHGCSFESITLPKGFTELRDIVLGSCDMLKSVVIPEGVTLINVEAFSFSRNIESITIPKR